MTIKAIPTKIGMGRASPLMLAALAVAVAGCSGNSNNSNSNSSAASTTLPVSTFSPASAIQGSANIIALDPVNQAIWVPSYTLDPAGNLQYELISTAAAVAGGTAAVSKKVSMVGCDTPIGIAYASSISMFLVECGNSSSRALYLSAVDASSLAVTPIATPGLTWNGSYGGIIFDPQHSQAFVAGSTNVGLLQVPAGGMPNFEANSVTALPSCSAVSMAMDFTLQQVVIADPCTSQPNVVQTSIVSTTAPALNITQLPQITDSNGNTLSFQGAAFDSTTGILALSTDSVGGFLSNDVVGALNMDTYSASAPSVDSVLANGFLDYYIGFYQTGIVPFTYTAVDSSSGGLVALNPATHQVLVADAWGPNLLLMQLPTTILGPNGNLDNNGQPSTQGVASLTQPDASSAYAIAQTLVSVQTAGELTQFNAVGASPALVIDPVNNIAYVLANNSTTGPHAWPANTGITLALVSIDLSAPVPGACPSLNNTICPANWNPLTAQVVVP